MNNKKGFTMVEIIVVVGIIGLISAVGMVAFNTTRGKARDAKRLNDVSQLGRFLTFGCIIPGEGVGEYDLAKILQEYAIKYPQYQKYIPKTIYDSNSGSVTQTNYKYIVDEDENCVLYANLENTEEDINFTHFDKATPGGGKGAYRGSEVGVNGTDIYFQISN